MKRNAARIEQLLDDAARSQKRVVDGIEALLEAAQKLQGNSGGGGGGG